MKNSMLATGCRIEGTVDSSVVSRRVEVAKNSQVKSSIVMANCKFEPGSQVEYAVIDKM